MSIQGDTSAQSNNNVPVVAVPTTQWKLPPNWKLVEEGGPQPIYSPIRPSHPQFRRLEVYQGVLMNRLVVPKKGDSLPEAITLTVFIFHGWDRERESLEEPEPRYVMTTGPGNSSFDFNALDDDLKELHVHLHVSPDPDINL